MTILSRSAWTWILGFLVGCAVGVFFLAPRFAHAESPAWVFDETTSGSWDEYDLSLLGSGDVVIGNRWHATSTDALSICGFKSWWKKSTDTAMRSPILYFGYLPLGHTTGTLSDVTVIASSTVVSTAIGTSQTEIDTYLPSCLTVNHGVTWAIYYSVRTTESSYTTWYKDLGGDNHVQLTTVNASGSATYASGDRKMGMAQLITSEAPAVELPENCTYGVFCPLIAGIRWLFVPTSGVQSFFDDRKADLMDRVPFGYFETVSSTFAGLDPSGDSTTSTIVSIYASTTTVHQSVDIFNPTALSAAIPTNIKNFIHGIGTMAVWAVFFLWVARLAFGGRPFDFLGMEPPHDDDI